MYIEDVIQNKNYVNFLLNQLGNSGLQKRWLSGSDPARKEQHFLHAEMWLAAPSHKKLYVITAQILTAFRIL